MKIREAIEQFGDKVAFFHAIEHGVEEVYIEAQVLQASDFFAEDLDLDLDDEEFEGRVIVDVVSTGAHPIPTKMLSYLAGNTNKYVC